MIHVLVRKSTETYDSLGNEAYFIFDEVETFPKDVRTYQRRLEAALRNAHSGDSIVFNGPAWLIAIAGYMWYANEERINHNVYQFCKQAYKYKKIEGEIDDY